MVRIVRILRSTLLGVAVLTSVAGGLSGCVVLPYDGGYGHDHYYGDRHRYYNHWDHDRRW